MIDVLARRAEILAARRTEDEAAQTDRSTVLTVRLNDERFALDVNAVAQVIPLGRLTVVPGAAPAMLGVMAMKGEVVSVFDLTRLLDLPPRAEQSAAGYVLILKHARARIGLLVDGVDQIAAGEPAGQTGGADSRRLIRIEDDRFVLIENLERALAPYIHGDGQ